MSEGLRAALDVLVDHLSSDIRPEQLAALLLEVYPAEDGETKADTLERVQAEIDGLFEGLIGSVMGSDQ